MNKALIASAALLCRKKCAALNCERSNRCCGSYHWPGPGFSWFEEIYIKLAKRGLWVWDV